MADTKKQEWLERETRKVHDTITRDIDKYLNTLGKEYQRLYKVLTQEVKDLNRQLELGRISSDYMELRTNVLITQLEARLMTIKQEMAQELPKKLEYYESYSREGMEKILKRLDTVALPVRAIEFATLFNYKDYDFQSSISKAGITVGSRLNKVLTEGLAKGWDNRKYAKEIQAIEKFTKFEANRIARTETARVATEGSRRGMKEYGIERVEWDATLERRTCPVCASLHGKKFPIDNAPPLPRHPFCRCVLLPVVPEL